MCYLLVTITGVGKTKRALVPFEVYRRGQFCCEPVESELLSKGVRRLGTKKREA
jgi:hypothetical protein